MSFFASRLLRAGRFILKGGIFMSDPSFFEFGMLACFGFSWPFAIIKTVRTKNPTGKSRGFFILVMVGYLLGCISRVMRTNSLIDSVLWLYIVDLLMVVTDFILCLYYRAQLKKREKAV